MQFKPSSWNQWTPLNGNENLRNKTPSCSGFCDQHGAVPGQEFPKPGNAHQKGEFRVITRCQPKDTEMGIISDYLQNGPDVGRIQVDVGRVLAGAARPFVVSQMTPANPQVMKRGKLVTAPGRQPVGPA